MNVARFPLLSVVVPAYNEVDVLPEFHRRLAAAGARARKGAVESVCGSSTRIRAISSAAD